MLALSLSLACLPSGSLDWEQPEPIAWDDDTVAGLTHALLLPSAHWEAVQDLATTASAESCPSVESDGETLLGGCTDAEGQVWLGSAQVTPERVVFSDFGMQGQGTSEGVIETVAADQALESTWRFSAASFQADFDGFWSISDQDDLPLGMQGWVTVDALQSVEVQAGLSPSDCIGGQLLEYSVSYAAYGRSDPLAVAYDSCTDAGVWSDDLGGGSFSLE